MKVPDLVNLISERASLPVEQTKPMVEVFFRSIKSALKEHRRTELRGFGAFEVRDREPALRMNPKTGEKVHVGQRRKVVFKPSRLLVGRLRGGA
ncbi:MAG: integration host factor subunit beta [Candidatus Coatesbacteria bacterium]|nr:integration host factor subunit beta [Candidatus Coatesbacteria bacterium]